MHLLEKELESLKKEILFEKEKVSHLSSTVDKISAKNEILTNEIKRSVEYYVSRDKGVLRLIIEEFIL